MKRIDRYTYREEWSEEDGVYLARCLEFPSVAAHGPGPDRARPVKVWYSEPRSFPRTRLIITTLRRVDLCLSHIMGLEYGVTR